MQALAAVSTSRYSGPTGSAWAVAVRPTIKVTAVRSVAVPVLVMCPVMPRVRSTLARPVPALFRASVDLTEEGECRSPLATT